jgi:hypothetical protein
LRSLEVENLRLKRLVADLRLDRERLEAVPAKTPELDDRRTDASWLRERYRTSERRVCGLMPMVR